jgi:hypothetical protein
VLRWTTPAVEASLTVVARTKVESSSKEEAEGDPSVKTGSANSPSRKETAEPAFTPKIVVPEMLDLEMLTTRLCDAPKCRRRALKEANAELFAHFAIEQPLMLLGSEEAERRVDQRNAA